VFFILKGRWRFFWGRWGNAGRGVLEEGDIFNIPTGIFRGFENIGTDYGMIMAILGGDDAGGGVIWAPQVIEDAKDHGLMLGKNGKLYDSKKGQNLPEGVPPMPLLTDEELKAFPEPTTAEVVPDFVARYWDLMALSDGSPPRSSPRTASFATARASRWSSCRATPFPTRCTRMTTTSVLMPMRGHWRLRLESGYETILNPGDTALVKPGERHAVAPSMTGEASLYRVVATDDPAGPDEALAVSLLATHVGQPAAQPGRRGLLFARERGEDYDAEAFDRCMAEA
jgi:quercetin dioxygenase-like cupin family protein